MSPPISVDPTKMNPPDAPCGNPAPRATSHHQEATARTACSGLKQGETITLREPSATSDISSAKGVRCTSPTNWDSWEWVRLAKMICEGRIHEQPIHEQPNHEQHRSETEVDQKQRHALATAARKHAGATVPHPATLPSRTERAVQYTTMLRHAAAGTKACCLAGQALRHSVPPPSRGDMSPTRMPPPAHLLLARSLHLLPFSQPLAAAAAALAVAAAAAVQASL